MNEAQVIALQKNIETLVRSLSRFDYEGFNRAPPGGGWTAGQVAEHLLIIEHMALTDCRGRLCLLTVTRRFK